MGPVGLLECWADYYETLAPTAVDPTSAMALKLVATVQKAVEAAAVAAAPGQKFA